MPKRELPNEWLKIRDWHGSQNHGFEELGCQLSACEHMPAGLRFVRKGTPDGGVERFWTLPDGDRPATSIILSRL